MNIVEIKMLKGMRLNTGIGYVTASKGDIVDVRSCLLDDMVMSGACELYSPENKAKKSVPKAKKAAPENKAKK